MQREDFLIFSQFSDNLVLTLSRSLMQIEDSPEPVTEGSAELEKKLEKLSTQFNLLHSDGLPILQKYMKDSNSARLSIVTEMFSQKGFLQGVLIGDEFEDVRAVLRDMLYSSN